MSKGRKSKSNSSEQKADPADQALFGLLATASDEHINESERLRRMGHYAKLARKYLGQMDDGFVWEPGIVDITGDGIYSEDLGVAVLSEPVPHTRNGHDNHISHHKRETKKPTENPAEPHEPRAHQKLQPKKQKGDGGEIYPLDELFVEVAEAPEDVNLVRRYFMKHTLDFSRLVRGRREDRYVLPGDREVVVEMLGKYHKDDGNGSENRSYSGNAGTHPAKKDQVPLYKGERPTTKPVTKPKEPTVETAIKPIEKPATATEEINPLVVHIPSTDYPVGCVNLFAVLRGQSMTVSPGMAYELALKDADISDHLVRKGNTVYIKPGFKDDVLNKIRSYRDPALEALVR